MRFLTTLLMAAALWAGRRATVVKSGEFKALTGLNGAETKDAAAIRVLSAFTLSAKVCLFLTPISGTRIR